MRYQLLPYSYTLFFNAHSNGETVARALWMNFPEDSNAVNIDRQFMVGPAILVSPVLDQGVTSVNAYFPKGLWYSFADRKIDVDASEESLYKSIYTPLTSINVHVKGGSVVPLQDAAMTTTLARQTPFTLLTALCPGGKAFGDLFVDDGEQVEIKQYLHVSYTSETTNAGGSFTSTVNNDSYASASNSKVGSIVVMGTSTLIPAQSVATATLNGKVLTSSQIVIDNDSHRISFVNLNLPVNQGIRLVWNY
jgi:alpha-glucosidase